MGGRGGAAVVVLVVLLFVGCSSNDVVRTDRAAETPTVDAAEAFGDELDALCEPYQRAANAVTLALTRSETATRIDIMVDTLEDLLEDIRTLEPPPRLQDPFDEFRSALAEYIDLRHEAVVGAAGIRSAVRTNARAAALLLKLWKLSKILDAPDCPPRDIQEVHLVSFTSRSDRMCLTLIEETRKSGIFTQEPLSAGAARAALVSFADYQRKVVNAMKRSRPNALDFPPVQRLINVNEKREQVLRSLVSDFDSLDQASFEANLKRQRELWAVAKRIGDALGVIACTNVVPR